MTRLEARVIYAAALALAIGSAVLLTDLAQNVPTPRSFFPTLAKAIALTLVFQVGLVWAPTARGWQKWAAALLMVPSFLLYGGVAGEVVTKIIRQFPFRADVTMVAAGGVMVYAWTFYRTFFASSDREPRAR